MATVAAPGRNAPDAAPAPGPAGDLSPAQFRTIADLLHRTTGIRLAAGKEGLVRSRLAARFRALGVSGFAEYLPHVEPGPGAPEFQHFVDVLTTNKTNFFREAEHFAFMERALIPAWRPGDRLQLWSAGCSTGEEPYTLAMLLRETLGDATPARILATDISARVLARARAAAYPDACLDDIPPAFHAHLARRPAGATVEIVNATRAMVTFAQLNLMAAWPMRGRFDAIFCRNVMIYFDRATQERLVQRFAAQLQPGGYLFVGHSESLTTLDHDLQYVQPAVYRRIA